MRVIDMTEARLGRLTVIAFSHIDKKGEATWKCACECGNITVVGGYKLRSGHTQSCGCLVKEALAKESRARTGRKSKSWQDLSGQKFGRLEVVSFSHKRGKKSYWNCLCECGNVKDVRSDSLKDGRIASCGGCGYTFVNGRPVSSQQKLISEMVGGVLNYPLGKLRLDVCIPDKKIVIEYDSWYWHKNKLNRDRKRALRLLKDGWKVLCIKANTMVPQQDVVAFHMGFLCSEQPYREIVMPDWEGE